MPVELEAKFPDVDHTAMRKKLRALGATLVHSETLMRRKLFDFADKRLYAKHGWVRLRDEGGTTTLTYKQVDDWTITGMKEVMVGVSDFDTTCALLEAIGLQVKGYAETRRETWKLDGVEITLDTWPWVPTFIEIEGESTEQLQTVATKLELDWSVALYGSIEPVYQKYYDVTKDEVNAWPRLTFDEMPAGLEAKRRVS